jgi:hypothetical protein
MGKGVRGGGIRGGGIRDMNASLPRSWTLRSDWKAMLRAL